MIAVKIKWNAAYVMPCLELPYICLAESVSPVNTHILIATLREMNRTVLLKLPVGLFLIPFLTPFRSE